METKMFNSIYGLVPFDKLNEFCEITGNSWHSDTKTWSLKPDRLDYFQLDNPTSTVESKRWKRKSGELPFRHLNFQYALKVNQNDIVKALEFAKRELFDYQGKPIYLHDYLCKRAGKYTDERQPDYSYSKMT